MCFYRLMEAFYAAPVLRLPAFYIALVLDAYASDHMVGAVLLQSYKDKLHSVA